MKSNNRKSKVKASLQLREQVITEQIEHEDS